MNSFKKDDFLDFEQFNLKFLEIRNKCATNILKIQKNSFGFTFDIIRFSQLHSQMMELRSGCQQNIHQSNCWHRPFFADSARDRSIDILSFIDWLILSREKRGNKRVSSFISPLIFSAVQNGETDSNAWANQMSGTH